MDRLFAALDLPEKYTCSQGTVSTGMLRRFAYPNRWSDLVRLFGRAEPVRAEPDL
jgi:hypothetical protein